MKLDFFRWIGLGPRKDATIEDFTSPEAKAAAAWLTTTNPLRGMTASRMQNLFDASRDGDQVELQWLYNEIEKVDPTLLVCAERRAGALQGLDWSVKTRAERRTRGFDRALAEEQSAALEECFGAADMANLNDAAAHLARAFFRGYAHVAPVWSADGLMVERFELMDNWNFLRDMATGDWYWNPEAHAYQGAGGLKRIPRGELVSMMTPYGHIDYPAMQVYLRNAVGEKGWATFVERFGIPPCILTMPQDIPADQVGLWREQAEKVARGGSGAVPYGTGVNFSGEARGANPFVEFCRHQQETMVLMATGGKLTMLAESGSGTLGGGAHEDTWLEIRRNDSARISSAFNLVISDAVLDRAFPGRAHLAYFAFDTEPVPSPGEVFEDAAKARSAGYIVDQAVLEERTGYKLQRENTAPNGQPGDGLLFNRAATPLQTALQGFAKREEGSGRATTPETDGAPQRAVLAAFAKDTSAAAARVKELLDDPTPGKAEELLADIGDLIPEDPALASVIAEAMAAEFGRGEREANKEGECTSPNGPAGCKSPTCPGAKDISNLKDDQGEGLDEARKASLLKGRKSIEHAILNQTDVMDAMNDPELGTIDFRWDAHGFGIRHIIQRRNDFRNAGHPDAISGEDMARMIPSVITRGERTFVGKGLRRDVEIDYKGLHVVLTPSLRGKPTNRWVMTGYDINPEAAGYRK